MQAARAQGDTAALCACPPRPRALPCLHLLSPLYPSPFPTLLAVPRPHRDLCRLRSCHAHAHHTCASSPTLARTGRVARVQADSTHACMRCSASARRVPAISSPPIPALLSFLSLPFPSPLLRVRTLRRRSLE
ncbi:hypothetical protein B0H16DRAFT_1884832 [Mycena metata]|uniref:Uncharacterized protein n=1 Tax=Mycena metata TaxID=1033252 RepID=A0AAD7NFH9_9AGAR|nr:hypothetical protein B0H16DRAFT_1884832 [Mycena metata]